jgi:ABC-type transporter Mla MlaB component
MKNMSDTILVRCEIQVDVLSTTVGTLRPVLIEKAEQSPEGATLELAFIGTRMIDSAGLNLVVSVIRAMRARKGRVRARVSDENVHRTFLFTRLDQQLELVRAGS